MDNNREIYEAAREITAELVEAAKLQRGQILVVGCSTSEVTGAPIGTNSVPDVAKEIFSGISEVLDANGIYLAAQCCEHLNRAIIIEREALKVYEEVNVIPAKKAGGSFATTAYGSFRDPIAVEEIRADAGLDIGGTLIGMHLKKVAVPLRLSKNKLGNAILLAARTRPKFIGGERAVYNKEKI